jgi:hypothetical protein
MYESKHQPLAPRQVFYRRIFRNLSIAVAFLGICLVAGILGYHFLAGVEWIDSLHNASMILGGMGPVVEIKTNGGKVFSSFYALFCGVALLTNVGILFAPTFHRFLHKLEILLLNMSLNVTMN